MCDIWKANHDKRELTTEDLEKHIDQFVKLNVREILFSGGEALMHSNLWKLCSLLRANRMKISLLSTGLLLAKNVKEVVDNIDEVIVSLDGGEEVHDKIRNVPKAFLKLSEGVRALKKLKPDYRVTARCVLQRYNFADFNSIVKAAQDIGLAQISFLGADISTTAFNRDGGWGIERVSEVALTLEETLQLEQILEKSFIDLKRQYETKFIAESPKKMRRIVQYYKAINKAGEFPEPICNAPWVSSVIESDGSVLPCFFHKSYGNIYEEKFADIINSPAAIQFRKNLSIKNDPVCEKCVCSLRIGIFN